MGIAKELTKRALKALEKRNKKAAAKKAKEAAEKAAIKAEKAAREKMLKGAKVTTEKGVKVTKYPFDESAVEKAQTHVGRDWKHKHLDQLDWKKGGEVKKRKPTKEELNKIMKTGGGGKRAKEIIENLLAPIKNLPKGVMKTGGVRNVPKLPATPATPDTPMKRPRRRTGMTKGIDPRGQPRRLTEREKRRMIKQGERYKKRAAVHRMPDGTLMKGAKHGMKHGGSVKGKCKVDGIAIRGRTRAKHK